MVAVEVMTVVVKMVRTCVLCVYYVGALDSIILCNVHVPCTLVNPLPLAMGNNIGSTKSGDGSGNGGVAGGVGYQLYYTRNSIVWRA